ncbi:hypothetical protein HB762_27150 (plasmid) [Vibrio campbellii]|uniref:Uncharacterized protein n=1 Tax=Vibrio campbellii TaxID=680 RepID=A0ABY5IKY1_9VIBR|nr:hypothetical protein [Vibrio campbellii]UTZ34943.1 hypothetical protein HB762_27150 [Vibrio campbellii]
MKNLKSLVYVSDERTVQLNSYIQGQKLGAFGEVLFETLVMFNDSTEVALQVISGSSTKPTVIQVTAFDRRGNELGSNKSERLIGSHIISLSNGTSYTLNVQNRVEFGSERIDLIRKSPFRPCFTFNILTNTSLRKNGEHAAILLDGEPLILTGLMSDIDAVRRAVQLCEKNLPDLKRFLELQSLDGRLSFGSVDIGECDSYGAYTVSRSEPGVYENYHKSAAEAVAVVMVESCSLADFLATQSSTASILLGSDVSLNDGVSVV